VRLNPRFR